MRIALIVLCLGFAAHTGANTPNPCDNAQHRAFDFWVGQWQVSRPDGEPAGRNRIARIEGGCGLHESWTSASGMTGQSLNAYDPVARRWRQFWIGADGTVLVLEGGMRDGAMVMEGRMPATAGARAVHNRITWTPRPDGSVRQRWETQTADGKGWNTLFDGLYRRSD
jgi:hypothetical protein